MNNTKQKKVIGTVLCIILILVSWFPMTKKVSDPKTYSKTIGVLDEKTANVLELTAVTTGISTAITLLPDDTGTTVADHLMDLNSSLVIVLIALFLEKYLLTIVGRAVFLVIVPVGLIMIAIGIIKENKHIVLKSTDIICIGILLFVTIPIGVDVSNNIEKVYQFSLEDVIEKGKEAKVSTEDAADDTSDVTENGETEEKKGNIITDTWSKVTDTVSGAVTGAMDTVTGALDKGKEFLKSLTEAFAILIVTSCVIPFLILVLLLWLLKMLTGLDFGDKLLSLHHALSAGQKKAFRKAKAKDAIVEK